VELGAAVAIVEAMKTEITVRASASGSIRELCLEPGAALLPGDRLALLELD
jgi:biotin carboxyl carrier protein